MVQRSLLICANARSGSFMLCRALADTGRAGVPDEYLLAADPADFPEWGFWEHGLFGRAWDSRDRNHYLEQVFTAGSTPNGIFSLKLMWNQVPWIVRLFQELPAYQNLTTQEVFVKAFPGLWPVLLTRRDRLRQAVSWARASQENVWEVRDDLPAEPTGTPVFDPDLITAMEELIIEGENGWRRFFTNLQIEPLEIVYEDMIEDLSATVINVLDYLNVSTTGIQVATARTVRQADELNDQWVQNMLAHPNRLDD